jgi:hypothetical protein
MIQLLLQYKAQSRQLEINSSGIEPKVRSWNENKKIGYKLLLQQYLSNFPLMVVMTWVLK